MRHGLFTIGALDNLDHNPSSTTAKDSFHGTGISLFQLPTVSNEGYQQSIITLPSTNTTKIISYLRSTTVPAVVLNKDNIVVPKTSDHKSSVSGHMEEAKVKEKCWLEHGIRFLTKDELEKGDAVSWASYHADTPTTLTQLMPLFYEKAASAAMVKHGMDVQRQATEFLNPGQIPVTAADAPLYALAKLVQWKWPHTHGEDKYVVMMGGLHIEMAISSTIGNYLEASGWATALTQAGVASSGTADSFLKASHLSRTRRGHQISALALAKLQEDAFLSTEGLHNEETKQAWKMRMIEKSPTFQFWDTVLRMELVGLIIVRAHREKNFPLYIESLKSIVPWFFAFDRTHYAR